MAHDSPTDRLILLLRDLASLCDLARDESAHAPAHRAMSPLAVAISSRSNAADDATPAQTAHLWHFVYRGTSKNAARVRAALLHRIAEEPLPGDPAAEYDPLRARVVRERLKGAPAPMACVLRVLRHVPSPYEPWDSVCVRLAESLAADDLRATWASKGTPGRPRVDLDVPSPLAWGDAVLWDALRWWEAQDGNRRAA